MPAGFPLCQTMNLGQKEFHIAPMIDVSTVEFRVFIRLLTKRAVIWNQMVVAETLVHRHRNHSCEQNNGSKESSSCELDSSSSSSEVNGEGGEQEEKVELTRDLKKYCGWYDESSCGFNPRPTVCQIGSNDPSEAAFATRIAHMCGYDSIDLNCECPSDRVAGRCFGAALMHDQDTASAVVSSMVKTSHSLEGPRALPVSVKTRIGVDEKDSFEFLVKYVQRLVDAGCEHFVIHARKVFTEGLSPAQNRTIPPLDYPRVYRLMEHFPQCSFLINGGMRSLEHAREVAYGSTAKIGDGCTDENHGRNEEHNKKLKADSVHDHTVPCQTCNLPQGSCLRPLPMTPQNLRGVMVGRLARDRPADLADVDRYFYGEESNPCRNRRELMEKYIMFLERVYPRRCCDDDDTVSLGMVQDMPTTITHNKQCCSVCQDFRGKDGENHCSTQCESIVEAQTPATSTSNAPQRKQSGKRAKRHAKYAGAKIVTRIIDRALQPTWGILTGEKGQKVFRRVSHEMSRDKVVRNCGPGYILWKAMQTVPEDVWDKPFELSGVGKKTTYYPTK